MRRYSFVESQAHGHVPRNGEARNTDLEECDVSGANLPRDISYDAKIGVNVAVQHYTEIIEEVNLCLGKAEPFAGYDAPKSSPNSVIFGGMSVPAATVAMVMDALTPTSTSREADALEAVEVPAFEGHSMFVWNRFVSPEKPTGVDLKDSLYAPPPLRAAKIE